MPVSAYTKITAGVEPLMEAINAGTAAWKVALTNASAVAKTAFVAGTDDLATANGYTAGGNACSITSSSQSAGTYSLVLANPAIWTAAGGTIGPFRYAVLWDSTTGVPVAQWDYGASGVTLQIGDTFEVQFGANVFTVT